MRAAVAAAAAVAALAAVACSPGTPQRATAPFVAEPTTAPSGSSPDTTATTAVAPSTPTIRSAATTRPPAAFGAPPRSSSPAPPATLPPVDPRSWTMGAWQPAGRPVGGGGAAVFTTTLRADVTVAVAQMDLSRLLLVLYAGTSEPGGTWPTQNAVPPASWPGLVAAFNSGFQMNQSRGGWYLNGRTAVALRNGAASLVIFANGSATVGQWGRDAQLTADVVAVRQNLDLLVDGGRPAASVAGQAARLLATWGYTLDNNVVTWRSAVGVDNAGRLLYAAGPALDPATLASALVAAGATRAMELDINPAWVSFDSFADGPGGTVGTKLIPSMNFSANHFMASSAGRDFFAVMAR